MLRSEGAGGLVELPTELLTRIFEHLSSVDLCRCACVTRTWTALCLDAKFWRAIHFDYLPVDAPTVLRVCRRYPRLHTVSLRNLVLDARTLSFIFRACPHIVKLSLASARVTSLEHVIQELSLSLHGLLDLDLSNLAITNGMLRRLEERCNRLERLNLSRCTLSPCETIAGGVRMLQLGHSTLRHLALCGVRISATELRCPSLESLDVSGSQLSDAMLFTMTVSSPRLLALSMADCRNVTDPAVKDMLALCRQLRSLDLSGCVCLTADVLREAATAAPQLESLTMARCSLLADLATIPLTSPSLTALDLSHCELLRALDVSSPSLDALTLTGCRSLARVRARRAAAAAVVCGLHGGWGSRAGCARCSAAAAAVHTGLLICARGCCKAGHATRACPSSARGPLAWLTACAIRPWMKPPRSSPRRALFAPLCPHPPRRWLRTARRSPP